jgi:hypothetical protein
MSSLVPIFGGLLVKLLTEKFFARLMVYGMRHYVKSTANELDDKIVDDVAKAWGVVE